MKTQKTNLNFRKSSLIELNDSQLQNVEGGSTTAFIDWISRQLETVTRGVL